MQDDQAHAFPDALLHALDDLVGDLAMGGMAPPEQHVGRGEALGGQAVLGLLERRGRGLDPAVLVERRGNRRMHAVRIERAHLLARLLMNVLAPDNGPNSHVYLPKRFGSHSTGRRWR